jgi:hypothetical protein
MRLQVAGRWCSVVVPRRVVRRGRKGKAMAENRQERTQQTTRPTMPQAGTTAPPLYVRLTRRNNDDRNDLWSLLNGEDVTLKNPIGIQLIANPQAQEIECAVYAADNEDRQRIKDYLRTHSLQSSDQEFTGRGEQRQESPRNG